MHLEPGDKVDRYVVEGLLGQGGMASVYRVRHRKLGTRHALKLLSIAGPQLQERLYQEGRVQAQLRHPNVVGVSDVIEHNGLPGLVMEYVEGPSLDLWLHHYRPSLEEALAVFRGVLIGVGAAHAQNLVHRDLKPGNVMLDLSGRGAVPRVADFGLVMVRSGPRATRSGTTMGTPTYMAPEQIRDASKVDRRADMYSLGVMLYELTTGALPYDETDLIELFQKVVAGNRIPAQERNPRIPDAVARTIQGLLLVDPQERIADCATALAMLEGEDPADLTWSLQYRPGEVLPEPTPLPERVDRSNLPETSPGIDVARGLVTAIDEVESKPSDPPITLAPSDAPSVSDQPRNRTGLWILASALVIAAALVFAGLTGSGVLLAALWTPTPTEPTVSAPQPPPPVPAPGPSPDVAPSTSPLEPPAPPPKPVPTPVQTAPVPAAPPSPTPVVQPPGPAPTPVPTGSFRVERLDDGLRQVALSDPERGVFHPGDPVPTGTYTIIAHFRDEQDPQTWPDAATIGEGQTTTIVCRASSLLCKAK